MNTIKLFALALMMMLMHSYHQAYSQINYSIKVESGFLKYRYNNVQVEPTPNWKGYYLSDKNGIDLSVINGIRLNNRLFAGIGIGYLNFEGINGLVMFSDIEYLPLKTRLTPLINVKIGYSHLWNQYVNGSGTGFTELCIGLSYRISDKLYIYTKSGFATTQQSLLIPISLGLRL